MTPAEAARILELPDQATPEQVESRFHELRTRLEEKIGKAPTPGLKAKYRESLDEITQAFETLALAADSSALPVLKREKGEGSGEKGRGVEAGGGRPEAGSSGLSPSSLHPSAAPRRKSGGMEFAIVAVIAAAVLGAGGWWVMKTRAENAEKARIAAEAKAEAERKAAAEAAQAARTEIELRALLAENGLLWDEAGRAERDADRLLAELRNEQRNRRDADEHQAAALQLRIDSAQKHSYWLRSTLPQHPSKLARARLEAALAAKALENAVTEAEALRAADAGLRAELARNRNGETALTIASELPDAAWELTDPVGETRRGTGSAVVTGLPFARFTLKATRPGFPGQEHALTVDPASPAGIRLEYPHEAVTLPKLPGLEVTLNGVKVPFTPGQPVPVPPGQHTLVVTRPGFMPVVTIGLAEAGKTDQLEPEWVAFDDAAGLVRLLQDGYRLLLDGRAMGAIRAEAALILPRLGLWDAAAWDARHLPYAEAVWEKPGEKLPIWVKFNTLGQATQQLTPSPGNLAALRPLVVQAVDNFVALPVPDRLTVWNLTIAPDWTLFPDLAPRYLRAAQDALRAEEKVVLNNYPMQFKAAQLLDDWLAIGDEAAAEAWALHPIVVKVMGETRDLEQRKAQVAPRRELREAMRAFTAGAGPEAVGRIMARLDISDAWDLRSTYSEILVAAGRFDLAADLLGPHGTSSSQLRDFLLAGRPAEARRLAGMSRHNWAQETGFASLLFALADDKATARRLVDESRSRLDQARGTEAMDWADASRALTFILLGDKARARAILERIDYSHRWQDWAGFSLAARLLDDSATQDRITEHLKGHSQRPPRPSFEQQVVAGEWAELVESMQDVPLTSRRTAWGLMLLSRDGITRLPAPRSHYDVAALALALLDRMPARVPASPALPLPRTGFVEPVELVAGIRYFPYKQSHASVTQGSARVEVAIDETGSLTAVKVLEATHPDFGASLETAVRRSYFRPAYDNGRPVAAKLEIEQNFNLRR